MNTEPARIVGTLGAVVSALLVLLAAFGLDVTADQQAAILGLVAVAAPIAVGFLIRGKVYAPATVERLTALPPVDPSPPQALPEGRGPRLTPAAKPAAVTKRGKGAAAR